MARFFNAIDRFFTAIGQWLGSPLLLALRLFFGIGFIIVGVGKLQNISHITEYLTSLHIPFPAISAWALALTETIGGFLLVIGFLSRLAAVPLIFAMCVAYGTAHVDALHHFVENPRLIVEQPPFNFLLTALLVFAFGPGFFSVDALIARNARNNKPSK
jgi:putative oxidoreductase